MSEIVFLKAKAYAFREIDDIYDDNVNNLLKYKDKVKKTVKYFLNSEEEKIKERLKLKVMNEQIFFKSEAYLNREKSDMYDSIKINLISDIEICCNEEYKYFMEELNEVVMKK